MTRILSLLTALVLLCAMTPALAEGAPANPAPSASPETVIVPSMPDDGGYDSSDGMLSEEMREEISPKNILMMGPTGVGKTTMALAFATSMGLATRRVQFTPDTMPSDIIGFSVYDKDTGKTC